MSADAAGTSTCATSRARISADSEGVRATTALVDDFAVELDAEVELVSARRNVETLDHGDPGSRFRILNREQLGIIFRGAVRIHLLGGTHQDQVDIRRWRMPPIG